MKNKILYTLLFVLCTVSVYAQEKFTLSGTISDIGSSETLIGVDIYFPELKTSATTNEYGFFSITIPKGAYTITINYVGYDAIEQTISLLENTKMNFELSEKSESLDEVVITSSPLRTNIRKAEMSVNKLPIATIKKMPPMMGEVDVLKSILQLPGVANAQEGATGFNVRGADL